MDVTDTLLSSLFNNSPAWVIVAWFMFRTEKLFEKVSDSMSELKGVIQKCKRGEAA